MKFLFALFAATSLAQAAETPNTHNMIVFGTKPIYVSHLPMYEHDVHRYQAIYEVTFGEKADTDYREKNKDAKIFGIGPLKKFTMPSLQKGSKFPASLFPGHPEQTQKIGTVDVEILKVVHFHTLSPGPGARPAWLTYFKAGTNEAGESYLAHWLTTPTRGFETPADQFDQILRVKSDEAIPEGSWVMVPQNNSDTASKRLTKGLNPVRVDVLTSNGSFVTSVKVLAEDYLHTDGDVRVTAEPE